MIRAFIQARMSSARFPGKVLAPLDGRPVIAHVVERVAQAIPLRQIVVSTSADRSDDPLASYVPQLGVSVHRGPLDNVFRRLQLCLNAHPCTWFFRICADSPLLDGALLQTMAAYHERADLDLITNIHPRTFPRGRSLELLLANTYAAIEASRLSAQEQEHVTAVYYVQPTRFRILNIDSGDPSLAKQSVAVDRVDDLSRLEQLLRESSSPVIEALHE